MTCGADMCTMQNGGSRKKSRSKSVKKSKSVKRYPSKSKSRSRTHKKSKSVKRSHRRKHRGGAVRSGSLVQGNVRP